MKFSIIIPVKDINFYIGELIPYLFSLDYNEYEVIILPNNKPKIIPKYLRDPRIRIISTGKVSPAAKRDIGATKAVGEVLAFIDDDSYPQSDWLKVANETLVNLSKEFAAINGPAITPQNVGMIENVSGYFFESKFGGGAPYRCRDIGKSFEIDDAPSVNLLVYKNKFLEVKGFDSEYWPGEDSIFCQKLNYSGYKIWYQNNLIIFHHRRKTIWDHLKQVAGYGKHRGNFFRKGIGCSRKFIYTVPSLFLIFNLVLLLTLPIVWIYLIFFYTAVLLLEFSFKLKIPSKLYLLTAALTYASHLTYGLYFILGFCVKDINSRLR